MTRRLLLAVTLLLTGPPVLAQVPFPSDLVPTRSALERLGLERQWMAIVPLEGTERVLDVSMSGSLIFAHTSDGRLHTMDAESGRVYWSATLAGETARARPASANSFAVFVTGLNYLYAIDRATGRTMWTKYLLGTLPSSATACDEDRVMVGLRNGKIYAYNLKEKIPGTTNMRVSGKPVEAWNWQTGAAIETRPLPAGKFVAFGSDDGKAYVALSDERTMLYRIATGGAIGAGLGTHGTRLLLIPSADRILYGVDLLTSEVLWRFPSGAPIAQEPLVADEEIFVVNEAGNLSSIDPANGSPRWTVATDVGSFVSVGAKRVYLESADRDLFVVDRATGQIVFEPRATRERIGLNLRPYDLVVTNRENDRLYLATNSGMVICLREQELSQPRPLRQAKEHPFGYIPQEGVSLTPGPTAEPAPAAEGENPAEPPAAN